MNKFILALLFLVVSVSAQAQILNAGFENWTEGSPDEWFTSNSGQVLNIKSSTDAHSGSKSLSGFVAVIFYVGFPPVVSSSTIAHRGFYMDKAYTALNGWYKFTTAKKDKFQISVVASRGDTSVGAGSTYLPSVSEWTAFSIPISYVSEFQPDSCIIFATIVDSNASGQVNAGSQFLLDDLSYGYINTTTESSESHKNAVQILSNPCQESTTIRLTSNLSLPYTMQVFDQYGRTQILKSDIQIHTGSNLITIDTKQLPSGVYYLRVSTGDWTVTQKLIVLR